MSHRGDCLPEMPDPKAHELTNQIAVLCATLGTDIFRLDAKLGIDPMELLQMINGKGGTLRTSAPRHGSYILGLAGKPQFFG